MNPLIRNGLFISLTLFGAASYAAGKDAKILRLNEKQVGKIMIVPGRTTILSFPTKPTKVILGNRGLFGGSLYLVEIEA